jgi:hypothetical protein
VFNRSCHAYRDKEVVSVFVRYFTCTYSVWKWLVLLDHNMEASATTLALTDKDAQHAAKADYNLVTRNLALELDACHWGAAALSGATAGKNNRTPLLSASAVPRLCNP